MKKPAGAFLFVIFVAIVIPFAIVWIMGGFADENSAEGELIDVYFHERGEVVSINSEKYLEGVVAAEMPAEFEEEALKAQAVAARTYMYNHLKNGEASEYHHGAKLCTDYTHCQAWTDEGHNKKTEQALSDTEGEIMTYNGEIISAVFHSASSGMTENAADVWGKDVPYLVSVKSEGEENSPNFISEAEFSVEEYKNKIREKFAVAEFSNELFSDAVRSEAGGIITINAGGAVMSGTEFRNIFGLRSTNIELSVSDGRVKMTVKGNGHGVGMSQYGAEYMAENGADYREILTHYYTGVNIEKYVR